MEMTHSHLLGSRHWLFCTTKILSGPYTFESPSTIKCQQAADTEESAPKCKGNRSIVARQIAIKKTSQVPLRSRGTLVGQSVAAVSENPSNQSGSTSSSRGLSLMAESSEQNGVATRDMYCLTRKIA